MEQQVGHEGIHQMTVYVFWELKKDQKWEDGIDDVDNWIVAHYPQSEITHTKEETRWDRRGILCTLRLPPQGGIAAEGDHYHSLYIGESGAHGE